MVAGLGIALAAMPFEAQALPGAPVSAPPAASGLVLVWGGC